MARKAIRPTAKNRPLEHLEHTCGDCGWGKFTYEHQNLDWQRKPICLICPFTENRRRIRSEKACEKWKCRVSSK